ncbi:MULTISPECIES: arginine beta-hydroxylase, Fe(II)/alpha-ketoglutarate-dependent [unclassified Streptomyces]|uniref:arginine beta-hydroxylase, Fe(II)/alpha-ketoglutarate-dependent n=1 Tax=unclassified Streptomyces TaxID=2593676 RepID=UPI002E352D10|nr:arginine beta-hydroxylase, Fe(II)/alpha-ketoglutarate-dependent [Streptomyces sp. NBC_00696]
MGTDHDPVLTLTPDEARQTAELTLRLAERYAGDDDPELLLDLPRLASGLPVRTQRFLRTFATEEPTGFGVVSGHLFDQERIGPTPEDWHERPRPNREFPEEILVLLYAGLLGEPFGWTTQQDGRLVHDVFPVRKHEHDQLGLGSKELLTWHTEDAFHPYRGDYLVLASLRNPDRVATTVGEYVPHALSPADLEVLFEERFHIAPDESHLPKNNSRASDGDSGQFAALEEFIHERRPVAVLFGPRQEPYLRLDPYFMADPEDDPEARQALDRLIAVIDGGLREVALEQGDCLVINNHRVVHGRVPFTARFDGTDRWLKRINVTHDLRKSRTMRASSSTRLIG